MHKIVVIGGGGHAKVLMDILQKSGWDVLGYTDRQDKGPLLAVPYLGDDRVLPEVLRKYPACRAAIGVGKVELCESRLILHKGLEAIGFECPAVVSRDAVVNSEVKLGAATVVFDGVVINSCAKTGRACILNTHSTIEHDCRLGDNVHIAPGATLSGGVSIGHNCMIGTGANIIQALHICDNCIIGAGTTVVRNISTPGVYVGNPAQRIK